jgi:hypothetical protein
MNKPKKNTGNRSATKKPIEESKHNSSGQTISGHPESEGGSRQGNIGHEHTIDAGRGDKQV